MGEINQLEETHCKTCAKLDDIKTSDRNTYCLSKCEVGKRLGELGSVLLGKSDDEVNRILKKGRDMTTGEIRFLLKKGVSRKRVSGALKMNNTVSSQMFNDLEGVEKVKKEKKENPKSARETVAEMTELGKTPKEIHEKTGIPLSTVYTYRVGVVKVEEEKELKVEKTQETTELIAVESTRENVELKKRMKDLENENHKLKLELEKVKTTPTESASGQFEEKYRKEKRKHDLLFSYLMLEVKGKSL